MKSLLSENGEAGEMIFNENLDSAINVEEVDRNGEVATIMPFGCQSQRIGGFGEKGCGNWGRQ
jgi:hypothetical protein